MEFNKIFAAILVAGIIAMLASFVSHESYHPEKLERNTFPIAVADAGADAAAAPAADKGPEPIDNLMAAADPAAGEKIARVCMSCHTLDKGGPNRVGPNLYGIVGNHHAHAADFAYSDGMKAKSGETWDVEKLNVFLYSPRKAIDGTKMTFAGLKKPEDRAAVIKYLQTLK
jgi:cytochrome c